MKTKECPICLRKGEITNWRAQDGFDKNLRQVKCTSCKVTWYVFKRSKILQETEERLRL